MTYNNQNTFNMMQDVIMFDIPCYIKNHEVWKTKRPHEVFMSPPVKNEMALVMVFYIAILAMWTYKEIVNIAMKCVIEWNCAI